MLDHVVLAWDGNFLREAAYKHLKGWNWVEYKDVYYQRRKTRGVTCHRFPSYWIRGHILRLPNTLTLICHFEGPYVSVLLKANGGISPHRMLKKTSICSCMTLYIKHPFLMHKAEHKHIQTCIQAHPHSCAHTYLQCKQTRQLSENMFRKANIL